jgi:hypothetical protein
MKTTIDMAREAGCIPVRHPEYDNDVQVFATPDVLKRFEALVRADERAEMRKGFAGVTLWLGDAHVTQIVTELEIQHERVPGTALKHAAEKCLAVYAGAREAK